MPSSIPITKRPAWPSTVDIGQPGSSSVASDVEDSSESAKLPNPEPRIIPTFGRNSVDSRIRFASESISSTLGN
jgi:hypothetical protein